MPRYLFLTPITPAPTGNGLAMRAWQTRGALAALGSVSTWVVPVAEPADHDPQQPGAGPEGPIDSGPVWRLPLPDPHTAARSWLGSARGRALLERVPELPQRARLASPALGHGLLENLGRAQTEAPGPRPGDEFRWDGLVVLRGYLAGAALPLLEAGLARHAVLDLDECEHRLPRQRARQDKAAGAVEEALRCERQAARLARFTGAVAGWFDDVAVCSVVEVEALRGLTGRVGRLWPNVVDAPASIPVRAAQSPPRLLCVGNHDYRPNRDALAWLLREGFPALRAKRPEATLQVVGRGADDLRPEAGPGVKWLGFVDDLAPLYAGAAGALAPLRTGAGTRLKLLEAFAHGVPVVASPVAAEGLEVVSGGQLLLAEVGPDFVAAASAALDDPVAAAGRVRKAGHFVRRRHAPAVLRRSVAETFAETSAGA